MDEITKLKAECYDIVANIQQLQGLLEQKNRELAKLMQDSAQPKVVEKK